MIPIAGAGGPAMIPTAGAGGPPIIPAAGTDGAPVGTRPTGMPAAGVLSGAAGLESNATAPLRLLPTAIRVVRPSYV
jgi:hypothetical protein